MNSITKEPTFYPEINFDNLMDLSIVQDMKNMDKKKSKNDLVIHNFELRVWLDRLEKAEGIFFLDASTRKKFWYSMQYQDQATGKLMELDFQTEKKEPEKERKLLESLLFDLSVFRDNEPVVVFGRQEVENWLQNMANKYYEFIDAIDAIRERLVDLKEIFTERMYFDTRFNRFAIDLIYQGLFPGTLDKTVNGSVAMYKIYTALQNIFYQTTYRKVAA